MNVHILLVENDESLHRGIQFTLQQEGFSAYNRMEKANLIEELREEA